MIGIKESDTGLSQPSQWDLVGDKQMMQEEAPLQLLGVLKLLLVKRRVLLLVVLEVEGMAELPRQVVLVVLPEVTT